MHPKIRSKGGSKMTLQELKKMTVVKLREEAMKYPDVKGASAMKKDELIALLCEKLGIEVETKKAAVPATKVTVKEALKKLKAAKQEAHEKQDYSGVSLCRRKIRTQKRHLRRLMRQQ
jgi:cell division protein FtsX